MAEGATKRYYPVFLDLDAQLVVIVGGGPAALRKAKQLARCNADVVVICPDNDLALAEAEADGVLTYEHRAYVSGDTADARLVLCVDPDPELQRAVRGEAEAGGTFVNVLGAPDLCSFIVPTVMNREPLQIAISTAGFAPGLAKQIRRELSARYGPEYADYAQVLGEVRGLAYERVEEQPVRDAIIEAAATSDLLKRLKNGESVLAVELYDDLAPEIIAEHAEKDAPAAPPEGVS